MSDDLLRLGSPPYRHHCAHEVNTPPMGVIVLRFFDVESETQPLNPSPDMGERFPHEMTTSCASFDAIPASYCIGVARYACSGLLGLTPKS